MLTVAFAIEDRTVRLRECPDCTRPYEHITGFVVNDGVAHSIYYAACHGHPEHEVWLDMVLGTWGKDNGDDHVTFSCQVRREGAAAVDSTVAVAGESDLFGRKLTRAEALAHPWIADVWAVVDALLELDETIGE